MNSNWTDGYVTDIGYTHGYYPQLNPARLQLGFAAVGFDSPPVRTACELGFGQGLSVNMHAAASPVAWYGNDRQRSAALNRHLIGQAAIGSADGDIEYLASPLTGGGVPADRIQQLFMLAVFEEQHTPDAIIAFVWRHICAQGKKLVRDGVRLEDEQENLDELSLQAQHFFVERLPVLQALQVV